MLFQKTGNFKLFTSILLSGFLAFFKEKQGIKYPENSDLRARFPMRSVCFLDILPEMSWDLWRTDRAAASAWAAGKSTRMKRTQGENLSSTGSVRISIASNGQKASILSG